MFKKGERATPDKVEQDKKLVMHEVKAFVTPLCDSQNATKGLATVQVGELFKVGSVRINENTKEGAENFGKNFVAMPSRPDKSADGGYRDVVHPVNKEFGEKFRDTVLKQYDNQLAYKNRENNKEQTAQPHEKTAANKSNQDIG
jgi:DNA-binding cell septation regulator SpoVG